MISLRAHLRAALKRQKDTVGYNLAALRYIQRQYDSNRTAEFYEMEIVNGGADEEKKIREKIDAGLKKRKRAALRS